MALKIVVIFLALFAIGAFGSEIRAKRESQHDEDHATVLQLLEHKIQPYMDLLDTLNFDLLSRVDMKFILSLKYKELKMVLTCLENLQKNMDLLPCKVRLYLQLVNGTTPIEILYEVLYCKIPLPLTPEHDQALGNLVEGIHELYDVLLMLQKHMEGKI